MHRNISLGYCLPHFVYREISFWSYQYCGWFRSRHAAQLIIQIGSGNFFVTMGNKLASFSRHSYKVPECQHAVEFCFPRFMALFDSRNDNFVSTWYLDDAPFRKLAVQERYFVYTYFHSLLDHPFHTIHQLGGCNGQMYMSCPLGLLGESFPEFIHAVLSVCKRHLSPIECTLPIHQHHFVPRFET